jgi:hypothetical protein
MKIDQLKVGWSWPLAKIEEVYGMLITHVSGYPKCVRSYLSFFSLSYRYYFGTRRTPLRSAYISK